MIRHSAVASLSLLLTLLATGSIRAENWPAWRGPNGFGTSSEARLPLRWSRTENVRWHVELPGPGNSSPIVWGDRVFVSQSVAAENRRTLMCFDRATGNLLWQSGVTYTGEERTHDSNPYCAGTPATDGTLVYVCFGSPGVYAYDFEGNQVWHRDLGKLDHMFGTAVSPILHDDLCIVNFGPGEAARLVALDKRSGETIWEVRPPSVDPSELMPAGGGFGGPPGGGRGGFGPGAMLASLILSQADANTDQQLTASELTSLAESWFDKLDPQGAGKLSQEQFVERLDEVLALPGSDGAGSRRQGAGPGRGFSAGRFIGPGFFSVLDADKDAALTRAEMQASFERWSTQGDNGLLTEDQFRDILTAALPRPDFGGPGPGGGPGPDRGPGPGGRGPGGRGRPGGGPGGPGGGFGAGGFAQFGGSWSTPVVVQADGRDELVFSFPGRLVAYDPKSGEQLWISKGLGGAIYTTPVFGEGIIVAMGGGVGGGDAIAVRPGGNGDVTDSHRLWRRDRLESQMGSGVIHQGHLYTVGQEGIAACMDLQTGETLWQRRLRGPGQRGGCWASIVLADGRIYVPNQSGDVFVLRADPEFELLATNSVDESTNASLAASDGEFFMRTDNGLWCFAQPE